MATPRSVTQCPWWQMPPKWPTWMTTAEPVINKSWSSSPEFITFQEVGGRWAFPPVGARVQWTIETVTFLRYIVATVVGMWMSAIKAKWWSVNIIVLIISSCTSLSISDFDDDGFREDGSMSSVYTVFSSPRSHHPHHQLHHNHQSVPHHPNNTKGLFDIALKTVKLIRRNQELQMRLAQLQEETKAFIDSVMANPENKSLRNQIHTSGAIRTTPTPSVVVQKWEGPNAGMTVPQEASDLNHHVWSLFLRLD